MGIQNRRVTLKIHDWGPLENEVYIQNQQHLGHKYDVWIDALVGPRVGI